MYFLLWCGGVTPPLEPNQSKPLLVCHTHTHPFLYLVILLEFALYLSLRLLLLQLRLIIVPDCQEFLHEATSKMDVCFKMTTAVARLSTEWVGEVHVPEPPGGLGLCIFIILIIFSASSWIFLFYKGKNRFYYSYKPFKKKDFEVSRCFVDWHFCISALLFQLVEQEGVIRSTTQASLLFIELLLLWPF